MDIFGNFSKLKGDKEIRRVAPRNEQVFSYGDVAKKSITKIEDKAVHKSIWGVKLLVFAIFFILVFRLFVMQVVQGKEYASSAEGNRIRPRVIEANRGDIYDANGVWLARNKPSFNLAVYPSDLPKKKVERSDVYNKIAGIAGLEPGAIQSAAEKNGLNSLDEIVLKEDIPHDEALLLEEKIAGIPGFFMAKKAIREYQVSPGLAHLMGYTGLISEEEYKKNKQSYYLSDRIGKTGLESEYEKYLKGVHGIEQVVVDSKQNTVKILVQNENKEPVSGDDLTLYLDSGLQQKAGDALRAGIESGKILAGSDVAGGVAAVMDVKTGGILAMVSLPDYDNNLFAAKISNENYQKLSEDKSLPLFDRAIKGAYPPGSISKIILASAGLMEKNITKSTAFDTPLAITIGDYSFPDWKDHGYTDIERAIAESNNVFFYSIGGGYENIKGLGIDKIKKWWELFGLGEETGIDLPGEESGLLPDPAWKMKTVKEPWYIGDTYHVSIGQGDMLVTPLQMLRATAVIASGGELYQPQLVKKIVDKDGKVVQEFGPRIERDNFIDSDILKTVQEGMRMTITEGSARNLSDLPISVAGKTGTAQFLNNQKTHAWFTCYAPYEDPQIAVTVLVEGGGGGHEIAAPVAKEILNYYFTK